MSCLSAFQTAHLWVGTERLTQTDMNSVNHLVTGIPVLIPDSGINTPPINYGGQQAVKERGLH